MKHKRISVKWKFVLYMMTFLLILLGLLWLFQVVLFENIYKSIKTGELRSAADSIAENAQLDVKEIDILAERIAQNNEICVMLFNSEGRLIVSKDMLSDCLIHKMSSDGIYQLVQSAMNDGGEHLSRFQLNSFRNSNYSEESYHGNVPSDDKGLSESIIFTKIVELPDTDRNLIIILNSTVAPVGSTVLTLKTELLILSVIMLVTAILLSLILAKRVSKPIIELNKGAKQLAVGKYDAHFSAEGYREISELSDSLEFAQSELRKTENLQRELIANISHDLRTPLTMIEGYAEMLRDIPGENTPENIQIIIDESKRLTSLVNDVLEISRLQSGTQELVYSDFALTETVRQIIERFSKLCGKDGWQIDFEYGSEVTVYADALRITQVIYNFINNAITHSGDSKTVKVKQTVKCIDGKNKVRIEVTDYGDGIAENDLPYIWDRYYKVDKHHRRAADGSGLGLSIVKGILDLHGAEYGVVSELGIGSTFWFEL